MVILASLFRGRWHKNFRVEAANVSRERLSSKTDIDDAPPLARVQEQKTSCAQLSVENQ
jgi:hypothetical protein